MKKLNLENKNVIKILAIVCAALSVMFIIIGIATVIFKNVIKNEKDEMTVTLEELGKAFYEDFYYEQLGSTIEEKSSFLSQYQEIGIKISLETISKHKENKNKDLTTIFINKENNKVCNFNTIRVIIYPQKPYKKDSYKMITEIEC